MNGPWAIALHGGAGAIPAALCESEQTEIRRSLESMANAGGQRLAASESAVDVVQFVVEQLEDDPRFNAGHGAVLCSDGSHELEAALMSDDGMAGSAALLRTTRHPIALARLVKDRSDHLMLVGESAESMGRDAGLEQVANAWFRTEHRAAALQRVLDGRGHDVAHHATVGAVALDVTGSLAAATSTGGMTGKRPGRIGDTPILGAGTWADRRVAVSCTGRGEAFMQHAAAAQVAHRMRFARRSLEQSATEVLAAMPPEVGGLIAVDSAGAVVMPFTSAGMYRAAVGSRLPIQSGIGSD